jgi:hypothetical protein
VSAFCQRPVRDNADGGEHCGEPVLPSLDHTCYDHARVCPGPPPDDPENEEPWRFECSEPTEYDQNFCPEHYLGDEDQINQTNNQS